MVKQTVPCLNSLKISDLSKNLPRNVYPHSVGIQYTRRWSSDKPIDQPDITIFKIYKTKENLYIPHQPILFNHPLFFNNTNLNASGERCYSWGDFVEQLKIFKELAFTTDPYAEERLYIGEMILLEIPADYTTDENKWKHTPLDSDDALYDDVPIMFHYFLKSYKVLGADLGDILPGGCTKPADLVQIDLTKTKRTKGDLIKNKGVIRCYHHDKKNVHVIKEKEILQNASMEWAEATFPGLFESGMVSIRECEGDCEMKKRFRARACNRLRYNVYGET